MYTFGEQTVVIPLQEASKKGKTLNKEKISEIKELLEQYTQKPIRVVPKDRYGYRFEIYSSPKDIPSLIGAKGSNIKMLENILQVKLDINKTSDDSQFNDFKTLKRQNVQIHKRTITINFPKSMKNRDIHFYLQEYDDNTFKEFFAGTTSKTGKIKLATKSEIGLIIKEVMHREDQSIFWK